MKPTFTLRFSPCIMCVQYDGGIMMHVGGYYEYRGGVQYHGCKNLHYRHPTQPLRHRMERHACMGPTT